MSLQVPLPLTHANQVTQWSSFEVYTWITKHNDKFGLSQDDLDSIEESPLTGKQLMSKDDEQLSQEWAISIHAARKIVKKASSTQKKAAKRKSEPIIQILNNETNGNNNNASTDPNYFFASKNKQVVFESKTNDKASSNPSLNNIPENDMYSDAYKQQRVQSPIMTSFTPKQYSPNGPYTSFFQSPHAYQYHKQYQQSLLQTKLTLTIKNDTFMARLSHPKWWMDGHFSHIPNKIGCKDSISIEITGDLDTPLVGLMSFTLTLDPRFASIDNNGGSTYAFSPYVGHNGTNVMPPHIPSWMIGPGGLPYIPPSVTQLYQLQQQYITKLNELQKEKVEKKEEIERKKKRKEERRRMKQQATQHRLAIKREKKKIKREEKRKKREQKAQAEAESKTQETETIENDGNNKDKDKENVDTNINKDEIEEREDNENENENENDDGNNSVIEKESESEEFDSDGDSSDGDSSDTDSEYSVVSDISGDDELGIEEPPKYRLIVLWSITPKKIDQKGNVRNDRRDDVGRNSMAMMSVASSDLLHQMNRFNVLLLEDDTDPNGPDEFNLDNSYFNELEQAALIADIEQCIVDNEHFEIAATFGTSPLENAYTLQIDIDDSLGDWPGPLAQFGSNNPFALGFIPTNIPMTPFINPYQQQHTGYTPYTPYQNITQQSGYPDITIIPNNKNKIMNTTSARSALIPPKSGRRSRSNSQPAPPVGMGMNGNKPINRNDDPHRLSKTFTLSDVLSASRHHPIAIPENSTTHNTGGYSPISPLPPISGSYSTNNISSHFIRPHRMRKNSAKAPRLSLLKEQINQQQHQKQHYQQQHYHAKNNLFVPTQQQQQQQQQNNSPSLSPINSPNKLPMIEYEIGDCVFVDDSKLGQIKSIGQHPAWGKGAYYGIRLTEKIGNCDGEWKGQRTFSCPPGYGYFVQRNQLTQKLKTTRFDFINENYIEDKKKEFEKLKESKQQSTEKSQFAAEILQQKQKENSDDDDPGLSDIPKPGTNVAQIMGQSSSERILSKTKPTGKYTPKFDNNKSDLPKKEPKLKKSSTSSSNHSEPSHRRQRSNSKPNIQAKWTGGAPRTIVVRNKIPPIKEHTGYLHCIEGVKYQQHMEWKKAIEKFKLGIALLEVTLMEIDRSMTKRKWKAQIEEFRHKMSRCTFEIQNNKRSRFIKKRNAIAKEQAIKREQAALQIQAKKMKDAKAEVIKREDNWKVTREDMDKKIADNEIDPNYDPSTGIRPDSDDEVNSGRVGGDKTLAKAKKDHKKKKKKKGKKGKEDWSKYPGYENSGKHKHGNDSEDDDDDDDKKKDSKISKHDKQLRDRIEGDVMTADTDVSFSDVVGLNNVKLALYETIILPYIRPDLFESVKKSTQGLLLFGPPGNGKTMIAKCVASECDATFFSISASSITSKFVGEAERIMRTLFQMARQRAPSIIFIDEIDSLLRARGSSNEGEASRKIKTEFLIQFDGVKTAEAKDKTITVIGATNLPDQLDNAVLRRFPKRIMVPNPDPTARYSLIRLLMSKQRHNLSEKDFRELADKTENYSCSDIAMLCNDAAMGPLRSMKGAILLTAKKSDIPKIALVHFENSLLNIRASSDAMSIKHYFKWDEQFGSKLFLTMDVLPDNMKQKPLLTVEEEKRKLNEAEQQAKQAIIDAENEKKQLQEEKNKKKKEKQKLQEEKKRLVQKRSEKEENKKQQSKLLKMNVPEVKNTAKSSKLLKMNAPEKKLLKINAPPQKSSRRKSENLYQSTKRKSKKLKNTTLNPSLDSQKKHNSARPQVLSSKTFKISGGRHIKNASSGDGSESFADKKKLWNKRSSKSGNDKKKKVKK